MKNSLTGNLHLEHREWSKDKLAAHQLSQGDDEEIRQPPAVVGWTIYEAVSLNLLGRIGPLGKTRLLEESTGNPSLSTGYPVVGLTI